jgi:hypothetical protein
MAMSHPDCPERTGYHVSCDTTLPWRAERLRGLPR